MILPVAEFPNACRRDRALSYGYAVLAGESLPPRRRGGGHFPVCRRPGFTSIA
jgi:hypothetical protein